MTSRRQSWSDLVAEQRNNQPGRCDVRWRPHTESPRHHHLHAAIFTKRGTAAEHLWTQKDKGITSIQLIYTQ